MVQPFWKPDWKVFYKVKHVLVICPFTFTPRYLPKNNENICVAKDLYTNAHNSFGHNSQDLEPT